MSKLGASPLDIPEGIKSDKLKKRQEMIKAMQETYANEVQEIYDDICVWLATPDEDENVMNTVIKNQNLLLKAAKILLKGNLPMQIPDIVDESEVDTDKVVDVEV